MGKQSAWMSATGAYFVLSVWRIGVGRNSLVRFSSHSCGVVSVFQRRSSTTSKPPWRGEGNATEQYPFFSIDCGETDIIRDITNWLWAQNRHGRSIFSQTEGHHRRAAMAKPEILHSIGFARAERWVAFEAKKSALFERVKRSGTRRIGTLGDHNDTLRGPSGNCQPL
jgi:hypothetical protein